MPDAHVWSSGASQQQRQLWYARALYSVYMCIVGVIRQTGGLQKSLCCSVQQCDVWQLCRAL
jgi:hypothetical protein